MWSAAEREVGGAGRALDVPVLVLNVDAAEGEEGE